MGEGERRDEVCPRGRPSGKRESPSGKRESPMETGASWLPVPILENGGSPQKLVALYSFALFSLRHFSSHRRSQSFNKFCAMVLSQSSSPAQKQKLRVLCLHGFRTSGSIMERQLAKWDRTVLDLLDTVFLDAPFPATGNSDVEGFFAPPYFEWFQFERTETDYKYRNLEECIRFISNFMDTHGPFDGFVGFSQGAFLSAALAGMQQQGLALTSIPALRFVIIISGGVLTGEHEWKDCYSEPIKCPSVHLIGENDFLKASNENLLLAFENPTVIRHGAKHTVPRLDKEEALPIKAFLQDISSTIKDKKGQ